MVVRGRVLARGLGTAVAGVWVRIVSEQSAARDDVVRTGPDGVFRLPVAAGATVQLEVADRRGRPLVRLPIAESHDAELQVELDAEQLAASAPATGASVLRPEVMPTLRRAVEQLHETVKPAARAALAALDADLPPIASIPDLLDLARDVLLGRAGATRRFIDHLRELEAWNASHYPALVVPSAQTLEARVVQLASTATPHRAAGCPDAAFDGETMVTLLAAAVVSAGSDLPGAFRNAQIMHGQLWALDQLSTLHHRARATVLEGSSSAPMFQRMLRIAGNFGIPMPISGGGTPWGGSPFPIPEIKDRDPIAELLARLLPPAARPGRPVYPEPGDIFERRPYFNGCNAAEIFVRLFHRATFRVQRIEPQGACHPDVITIHGSGLAPGGHPAQVGFPVRGGGGRRFVLAASTSDTAIEVQVPQDAVCGELELILPATEESFVVCGHAIEVLATTEDALDFHGGQLQITALAVSPADCVRSRQNIDIAWELCNAQQVELLIEVSEGPVDASPRPEWRRSLRPDPRTRSVSHVLPRLSEDGNLTVTLTASGRCGRDQRSVRRRVQREPSQGVGLRRNQLFANWHGNVRRTVTRLVPNDLEDLVRAVHRAEAGGARLAVAGSRWSYSDCISPPLRGTDRPETWVIDPSRLDRILRVVEPALQPSPASILRREVPAEVGGQSGTRERLFHVEAGIRLEDLNWLLDANGLSIPNLGGSRGQTLAGAIQTGTHGATVRLPPIHDLVRAIHLVANGGRQWWIERASSPITYAARMRDLIAQGRFDPCLRVEYDDALFDACLVMMGQAGIVYSMVIECVASHYLEENTRKLDWEQAKQEITERIGDGKDDAPWYYEASLNSSPQRPTWITTREPTTRARYLEFQREHAPTASAPSTSDALWLLLLGTPLTGLAVATLPVAAVIASGPLVGLALSTAAYFTNIFIPFRRRARTASQLAAGTASVFEAIGAALAGDGANADRHLAQGMPNLLNALWAIGLPGVSGRAIVDSVQNIFTSASQRPPGSNVDKSYTILTEQAPMSEAEIDAYRAMTEAERANPRFPRLTRQEHSALERLVHSQEYAVPLADLVPFTDAILEAARRVRQDERNALIVILNLRVVQKTRASLAMQRFDPTGLVEVWTIDGLNGNEAFHTSVFALANQYRAVPHWGHIHEVQDLRPRFPGRDGHAAWTAQLDRIARAAGRPNTFRTQFSLDRSLLEELSE